MTQKSKPLGVVAIAVWAIFSGIILLPLGFIFIIAGQVDEEAALLFTVAGILSCGVGVFLLAFTYGLWKLQSWGRLGMFWITALLIPLGIISIFPIWPDQEITAVNTILQLFGIGIDILIMSYLARPKIRSLFNELEVAET